MSFFSLIVLPLLEEHDDLVVIDVEVLPAQERRLGETATRTEHEAQAERQLPVL